MNINTYSINFDTSIKQAMKTLDIGGIGFLCIIKNDEIFGIITDGDIRRAILNDIPLKNPVSQISNTDFVFLNENYSKSDIENKFDTYTHIKHIPVINKNLELLDIITEELYYKARPKTKHKKIDAKLVIMAGGKGTRLMPFTQIIPKPLIPIGNKSMIETIMEEYSKYSISDFYISVNYKAAMIKAYFEDVNHAYTIKYIEEDKPLGTAGALYFVQSEFKNSFFVANCDIIIKADYAEIYNFHQKGNYDITLVASMQHYKIPYGVCRISKGGELIEIKEKPEYDFLVNTGMYVLEPKILKLIPKNKFYHITDLMADVKKNGGKIGVFPVSEKSWIDIGQMEEYKKNLNLFIK